MYLCNQVGKEKLYVKCVIGEKVYMHLSSMITVKPRIYAADLFILEVFFTVHCHKTRQDLSQIRNKVSLLHEISLLKLASCSLVIYRGGRCSFWNMLLKLEQF